MVGEEGERRDGREERAARGEERLAALMGELGRHELAREGLYGKQVSQRDRRIRFALELTSPSAAAASTTE